MGRAWRKLRTWAKRLAPYKDKPPLPADFDRSSQQFCPEWNDQT